MCIAMALYCIRLPYNQMITAAGHFKQTQNSAIIEATINLTVSIMVVYKFGLIGVAFGTLVAVFYRTVYFTVYLSRNILKRNMIIFVKYCIKDSLLAIVIYSSTLWLKMTDTSYFAWIILALKVTIIAFIEVVIMTMLLDRKRFWNCFKNLKSKT